VGAYLPVLGLWTHRWYKQTTVGDTVWRQVTFLASEHYVPSTSENYAAWCSGVSGLHRAVLDSAVDKTRARVLLALPWRVPLFF